MSVSLLGSLVVAPEALPTPAAKTAGVVALKTASEFAQSHLGSYVRPLGGRGFIATSLVESGGKFTLSGHDLTGKFATTTLTDPVRELTPRWARRLASFMRVAWTPSPWDAMIRALLEEQDLPTDSSINWTDQLNGMFHNYGYRDQGNREQAISDAISTIFFDRQALERYNPEAQSEDVKARPTAQRLTSYILGLFNWWCKENTPNDGHRGRELTTLDKAFETDWGMGTPKDYIQSDYPAPDSSQIRSLDDFKEAFHQFLLSSNRTGTSGANIDQLMTLLDLATNDDELVSGGIKAKSWEDATGTSTEVMRRRRKVLQDELLRFITKGGAPDTHLTNILRDLRGRVDAQPEGGNKAKPMASPAVMASLALAAAVVEPEGRRFMALLTAAVRSIAHGRTAAPKVVDHSILYFRMSGDTQDPRFMHLDFYSPKLRLTPGTGRYKIEVGDWSTDQSLPQAKIKQQLGTFVIPMMRGDVLDEDHDLLEKVIRQLRSLVWDNAVTYFQLPLEEKATWRNTVKMDLQRLQDAKVTVRDEDRGTIEVAAGLLRESSKGRLAHRIAADSMGAKRQISLQAADWGADDTRYHAREDQSKVNEVKSGLSRFLGQLLNGLYVQPGGQNMTLRQFVQNNSIADLFSSTDRSVRLMGNKLRSDLKTFLDQNYTPDQIKRFEAEAGSNVTQWLTNKKIQAALKQAADANGQAPESTPRELSSASKEGAAAFDPALHEKDSDPSITYMAKHLEASGVDPTSDNMHEAVEGFNSARDAHFTKEASVSITMQNKFAGLKRIAAETPESFATAITDLKGLLQAQIDNLGVMEERLGATEAVGEVKEGEPVEVKPVEGAERLAAFKRYAAENPEALEEAMGEFYTGIDEIMARTEALAEHMDIELPAPNPDAANDDQAGDEPAPGGDETVVPIGVVDQAQAGDDTKV